MTTTLASLREDTSKMCGDWWEGTTTGVGTTLTLVDTSLPDRPYEPDAGEYALLTSGTYIGQRRKIASYDSTTTTITVNRAFTATGSGVTYEVHAFDPDMYLAGLNWARVDAYPCVHKKVDIQQFTTQEYVNRYTIPSGITDITDVYVGDYINTDTDENIIADYNADFQGWTGGVLDDWGTATNLTVTAEDDDEFILDNEDYACKCVSNTSAGSQYLTLTSYDDYGGKELTYKEMIYCMTASRVKVSIYDTSAHESTSYHSGNGWEEVSVSYTMPASPSALKVGVTVAAGTAIAFYRQKAGLYTSELPAVPCSPVYGWRQSGTTLEFIGFTPPAFRPVRLRGITYLSALTTDTTTVEIDAPHTDILCAGALVYLYRQRASNAPATSMDASMTKLAEWLSFYEEWKRSKGMSIPPMHRIGRHPW